MRLLVLVSLCLAQPEWVDSLEEAKAQARRTRKPVLCVVLDRDAPSRRLEQSFDQSRLLGGLLDRFVCVKVQRADSAALVRKYDLRHSPASIIYASVGSPMKLVVGPVTTSKYASHLKAALKKHDELWKPKRSKTPVKQAAPKIPRRRHAIECPKGCAQCEPAIARARRWLDRRQEKDGRWRKPARERVTRNEQGQVVDRSIDRIDVALTALAGLALHRNEKALDFLESCVRADGIVSPHRGQDHLWLTYTNFETPLAAICLAEAGRTGKLPAIAQYLLRIQDKSGAWGYSFDFGEHSPQERRGWRLLATTHVCLTALKHIRAAGVAVPDDALERGARYLLSCRSRDGAFGYRTKPAKGEPGSTAGALYALSGLVDDAALEPSWRRYRRHYREIDGFGRHWWWFLLHTALAMHDRGPGTFAEFHRHFRDVLLHRQNDDGSWSDKDEGGSVLATAVGVIVLQLGTGRLKIATARRPVRVRSRDKPTYLPTYHPRSRAKVYWHDRRYHVDLVVSIDDAADADTLRRLRRGLAGANRVLFDVTDGQMCLDTVRIGTGGRLEDEADIRITKDFYDRENNPHPWAHGITRLVRRTDNVNGREKKGKRIGEWILFPPRGIVWDHPRTHVVIAHELCHYLLGAKDEYNQRTGERYCACLLGLHGASELCRKADHTDDRQPKCCWELARDLYPRLVIPRVADPGPWDPPPLRFLR